MPNPDGPDVSVQGVSGTSPLRMAKNLVASIQKGNFSHVLLQYTAQMWGATRFGSVAPEWFVRTLMEAGTPVSLFAHELYTRVDLRPDLFLGALAMRVQLGAVMKACENVFVTTESRMRDLEQLFSGLEISTKAHLIRIAPNALPVPHRSVPGRKHLGVFSTPATTKRFDVVLDAFDEIRRSHPEASLSLLGDIGKTSDASTGGIRTRMAADLKTGRIRLPGKQSLSQIAREIAELDVYLFPMTTGANTRSGTLPLALGAGLPVIAVIGQETDSLFVDGDNIIFASAMKPGAFAHAALRVFSDDSLRDRVSKGARHLYDQHLSWERIGDAIARWL